MECRRLATLPQTDSLQAVNLQTFAYYLFIFAITGLLVIGCDSTGTSSDDPPESGEEGSVSFALARTENSSVPSDADSAFVRVWRPNGSFNLVEFVNIPDPGQQTEVSLDVPVDQGYRAGIIAVTQGNFEKDPLAYGASNQFEIQVDDTSQVALDVDPIELTASLPANVSPGEQDTVSFTYGVNIADIDETFLAEQSTNSTFDFGPPANLPRIGGGSTDSTVTAVFEITGPSDSDSLFVKTRVSHEGGDENWIPSSFQGISEKYFPTQNDVSFAIPVEDGDGDGTVIITFSMGEDGWEKTRRVVE